MYRPKKEVPPPPFIIDCQENLPVVDNILAALTEAQRSNVRPVEVHWMRPDSDLKMSLVVSCPAEGEPIWVLNEGQYREKREIWTYPCGDPTLVLNLAIAECTGETAPEAGKDKAGMAKINPDMSSSYSPSLLGLQASSGSRIKALDGGSAKITKVATMEGDLADMQVPTLLQSLAMGKMTGRLFVDNTTAAADLFFEDGTLVHATAMDVRGEQAIVELVTWQSGKFYFYRDEKTPNKNVTKRMDAILMESVTLLDQSQALLKAGLKMESFLNKANAALTEPEFDEKVKGGAPVDLAMQKNVYLQLDGTFTLIDLLRRNPMAKAVWVPILFNLLNGNLLGISNKSSKIDKTAMLESTAIDRTAIDRVVKSLSRPDTSLLAYPSFHYFLDQEFQRYQQYHTAFSVIIFDMWYWHDNRFEPLPQEALNEAVKLISSAKRQLDLFSHFEALSYALLLPHTETAAGAIVAYRMMEILRSKPIGPVQPQNLALAFGVAGIPEDTRDMGILLSAAKASKMAAQKNNSPVLMFKDMQAR